MSSIKNKIIFILLAITTIAILVPLSPIMPSAGLDPSWALGVNQAYSQGLIFGGDIVFTFGPYSSIYTKAFHPSTDSLMTLGSIYFGLMFFYVAYQNLKDSKIYIILIFIGTLSTILYSRDVLLFLYPFMVGTFLLDKLNNWLEIESKTTQFELFMLFSAFGLLPLIKGSILFLCISIIFLCSLMLFMAKKYYLMISIFIAPIVSLLFFWSISGQPLDSIHQYFISMLPIISGYTDAMAINGKISEIILYTLSALVILTFLITNGGGVSLKNVYLFLFTALVLFLAFKAGFVRHDGHAINSALTILLVGLLLAKNFNGFELYTIVFISLITCVAIQSNYNKLSTRVLTNNFINTYADLWNGALKRINNNNALNQEYEGRLSAIALNSNIERIDGHVDIYSYDQASLIASGNNWSPRPILQSYSVYTPQLALRNLDYLLGKNAPDVLLIKIQPIDGRLPSLEDGASWPIMYSNYAIESFKGGYAVLRKKEKSIFLESAGAVKSAMFGEKIFLSAGSDFVYARMHINKTFIGKVISFLFKPSKLKITLNLKGGAVETYRLIPGMAESGFIISPLIESETDFILGYSGEKYLKNKKVESFIVEPENFDFIWNNFFDIQLDGLTFQTTDALSVLEVTGVTETKSALKTYEVTRCDGAIDEINDKRVNETLNKSGLLMKISGWLSPSIDTEERYNSAYLVIENITAKRQFFELNHIPRPDVSSAFNRNLDYVGFKSILNFSGFGGDYFLRLAYKKDNAIYLCPMQKYSLRIENDQ